MCDVRNVLDAFTQKLGMEAPPAFAMSIFLFPHAVFDADWDNVVACLIRHTMVYLPSYARRLAQLQDICTIFKIEDYRVACRISLRGKGPDAIMDYLMVFKAPFAKWRYETLKDVVKQVSGRRAFYENCFERAMLGAVEDCALFVSVEHLCKDREFWVWVTAMRKLLDAAGRIRRWGRGCLCHGPDSAIRAQVHVSCDM